jgi:hypothetical protein
LVKIKQAAAAARTSSSKSDAIYGKRTKSFSYNQVSTFFPKVSVQYNLVALYSIKI